MKLLLRTLGVVLICSLAAVAQSDAQHFAKDGLAFDYPKGWSLQDESQQDTLLLGLSRSDSDVQIKVVAYRALIPSPEVAGKAKKAIVDPYVESVSKQFEQMGVHPERKPASTEIGGVKAEGVRIGAVLSGEPGAAEIYWIVTGQRLVVLTIFGPDNGIKKVAPAWDALRSSLQVEGPKPAVTPTPK